MNQVGPTYTTYRLYAASALRLGGHTMQLPAINHCSHVNSIIVTHSTNTDMHANKSQTRMPKQKRDPL